MFTRQTSTLPGNTSGSLLHSATAVMTDLRRGGPRPPTSKRCGEGGMGGQGGAGKCRPAPPRAGASGDRAGLRIDGADVRPPGAGDTIGDRPGADGNTEISAAADAAQGLQQAGILQRAQGLTVQLQLGRFSVLQDTPLPFEMGCGIAGKAAEIGSAALPSVHFAGRGDFG